MIRLLLFFLLLSCSQLPSGLSQLQSKKALKQKAIPVENAVEARQVIENQLSFGREIFRQSVDPYYGVPKWSPDCLRENKTGTLQAIPNGMMAVSEYMLSPDGAIGYCPETWNDELSYVVLVHCQGMNSVIELKFPFSLGRPGMDLCQ